MIFTLLVGLPGTATADSGARHFAALDAAGDCRGLRQLQSKAKADIEQYRGLLARVKAIMKDLRLDLDDCARANGFTSVVTEDEDRRLAETCYAQYQAWLRPGYRLAMLNDDIQTTSDSLDTVEATLRFRCGFAHGGPVAAAAP
jgi:hypothetical protein